MRLTIPNMLTILRLVAAPGVVFVFLYFARPWADMLALALFGIAMVLSVVQLRYVALMMSGVTSIVDADLSSGLVVVALILLVLVVILPQLAPILVYLVMGKGAESVLTSMNVWLTRNQRMVNVVVLGLFGAVLLAQSLPELWG